MSTVILEENVSLGQSKLWEYQRSYYATSGINAWADQVPYYITSNPFIAHSYAQIVSRFIQDLIITDKLKKEQPLYILELGAGHGRFSFYFLQHLGKLISALKIDVKFCYVMTDITDQNINFWQQHSAFQPYLDKQQLDFALFDCGHDSQITLLRSGVTLNKGALVNPVITIANYIFDSISADAFHFKNGLCEELKFELETPAENINDGPIDLNKLDITHHAEKIDPANHYANPVYNDILNDYTNTLQDSSLLLSIGASNTMNTIASWSNNRLLLISTDKAFSTLHECEGINNPKFAFHGSFSLIVNFHALAQYCLKQGGDAYLPSTHVNTKTAVFLLGDKFEHLTETTNVINSCLDAYNPGDYFNNYLHATLAHENYTLEVLISHFRFCHWDPTVFSQLSKKILTLLNKANPMTIASLLEGFQLLTNNIYLMPCTPNTYFDIGVIYHHLKDYRTALLYYKQSLSYFDQHFMSILNCGLCHYSVNELDAASAFFEQALVVNANSTTAKQWLIKVTREYQ